MKKYLSVLLSLVLIVFFVPSRVDSSIQENLKVHFIDVGQADSILIQIPNGKNLLIDAGNNGDGDAVVNYLKAQGVKTIDVLVGTHPHEDHIGGMDTVIKAFNIGKVYLPKVTTNTVTFRDVLTAIKNKGLKVTAPVPGNYLDLGSAVKAQILAPNSSTYSNLNNYSIVIKLTYGKKSFLFEGDAEVDAENEILGKGLDIKADVLKLGHHGSSTATSINYLNKVKPTYAVISCGKGNMYGHPHAETLAKLKARGIITYRTDLDGTIIMTSDGNTIKVNKKASPIKTNAPPSKTKGNNYQSGSNQGSNVQQNNTQSQNQNITVYATKTGECYHRDGCRGLSRSKIPMTLKGAKAKGLRPCKICNPPQ